MRCPFLAVWTVCASLLVAGYSATGVTWQKKASEQEAARREARAERKQLVESLLGSLQALQEKEEGPNPFLVIKARQELRQSAAARYQQARQELARKADETSNRLAGTLREWAKVQKQAGLLVDEGEVEQQAGLVEAELKSTATQNERTLRSALDDATQEAEDRLAGVSSDAALETSRSREDRELGKMVEREQDSARRRIDEIKAPLVQAKSRLMVAAQRRALAERVRLLPTTRAILDRVRQTLAERKALLRNWVAKQREEQKKTIEEEDLDDAVAELEAVALSAEMSEKRTLSAGLARELQGGFDKVVASTSDEIERAASTAKTDEELYRSTEAARMAGEQSLEASARTTIDRILKAEAERQEKQLLTLGQGKVLVLILATDYTESNKEIAGQLQQLQKDHPGVLNRGSFRLVDEKGNQRWKPDKPQVSKAELKTRELRKTYEKAFDERKKLIGKTTPPPVTILIWPSNLNPNDDSVDRPALFVPRDGIIHVVWVGGKSGETSAWLDARFTRSDSPNKVVTVSAGEDGNLAKALKPLLPTLPPGKGE